MDAKKTYFFKAKVESGQSMAESGDHELAKKSGQG